jgi:hypothetical protein
VTTVDPIAEYVVALRHALHGPRRTLRCMVAEAHTGLADAAAAYRDGGVAPERAAVLAVRDFGPVDVVAPEVQDELTARQGRRAAVLLAVVFPAMLFGWDLLWRTDLVRREPSATPEVVRVLALLQDVLTAGIAVAALALLAGTFRRTVSPRRLTSAVGLTGAVGAAMCGGISLGMNVAGGRTTLDLLTTNPAAMAAYSGSVAVLTLIVWLSVRTMHVARASG